MLPLQEMESHGAGVPLRGTIRRVLAWAACCAIWILAALPALAQHEGHESKEASGAVPRELLERPLVLRQGIGKVHEVVTTSSAEAQAYYDQGLAYLHSFVWIEAARSFHQALRLDPTLAMAYLGLSDAYVGLQDVPTALAASEKAQSLAANASERERARMTIRARQLEYLQDGGNLQKYFAYRKALTDALATTPNDPWLSPDNFAAHHYLAHTLENRGPLKDALEQSEIYVRMAPAIPHAHHMHGHDLRRAGRTQEAVQEFLKAEELENEYYRAENIPPALDWHHAHNLQLLGMSYEALGQVKAAEAAYRKAFSLPAYTDFADYNRKAWPEFLLDRGRAQEALIAAQELVNSRWAMARFAGHALAGRALLASNRVEEAKTELSLAERESEQISTSVLKSLVDGVLLRAEILLREKNWTQGNRLMEEVEKEIGAVPGPDAWSETLFQFEYIARIAREVDDWELAEHTARKMVEHDPSYAGGYLALGLVAEHQGDTLSAKQDFTTAEKLWNEADAELRVPQVRNP